LIRLDAREARLLGVLIEKALTTPEQYPLSLNAATNGANQKSNRDPVLELLESEVYAALQGLMRKGLAGASHPAGGRVEKYRHNAEAVLELDTPRVALLAELLMRGPQTPGELRGRVSRMTPVDSLPALMELLRPLLERGLVQRLDPLPGSRAERYAQCLSPDAHAAGAAGGAAPSGGFAPRAPAPAAPAPAAPPAEHRPDPAPAATPARGPEPEAPAEDLEKRVELLEAEVTRLKRQLRHLAWRLGEKLES
jgi:uncharacterized protein